jgi:beta-phosphoglucomutase
MASWEKAVIFDLDGVLVDTYEAHYQSWKKLAAEESLRFSRDQFDDLFGRTSREIILEELDEEADEDRVAELDRRKEELYRELIRAEIPAMPGAVELIRALSQADFGIAVGTSGPPENVDICLEALGCADQIDVTVNGTEVTKGKPNPEVFLVAAERLGLEPSRCAVIEDAASGVVAARAAGMASLALASAGHAPCELSFADVVMTSLRQLSPDSLAELIDRKSR